MLNTILILSFLIFNYATPVRAQEFNLVQHVNFAKIGTETDIYVPINFPAKPYRKRNQLTKVSFRSNGCSCQELICGCCLDFNIQQFNFENTGCMNITFNPSEFSMTFNAIWNNNSVLENTLSGKNPPSICVPLPIPYLPITMDTCLRIFDITLHLDEQKMHACVDLEARIQRAPLLVLHFDCLEVGSDASLVLVKPNSFVAEVDYDENLDNKNIRKIVILKNEDHNETIIRINETLKTIK